MKILLSAYACEPDKGSEPAVGWNWVLALLRRGHQVHVLTRVANRDAIEHACRSHPLPAVFHYHDLPRWCRVWKHWAGGIYVYYVLWQLGAARHARRLLAAEHFDVVHHVTFASFRQPSFMGSLGIPFIFGPVGGGETAPAQLCRSFPLVLRWVEALRSVSNRLVQLDPLMRSTFSRAQRIFCATDETLACIPHRYRPKGSVQLAIATTSGTIPASQPNAVPAPRFLFVGRLLAWKGLHLALEALAQVRRVLPEATLRIIGSGPQQRWLHDRARRLGLEAAVEWVRSVPHAEIATEYRRSMALVFPSLHDSGGMVTLEALESGLPVICLDLGGPGAIVTPECGLVVPAREASENEVVRGLAQAMIRVAQDRALRERLSARAIVRSRQLTWDRMAETVCAAFEQPGKHGERIDLSSRQ